MRSVKFLWAMSFIALSAANGSALAVPSDLGHEVLGANDGWASFSTGVTGGVTAAANHIYTVTNRREFFAALNDGVYPPPSTPSNVPKIIYVNGIIDGNVDDNNNPLSCDDYNRNGYTLDAYLAAYDPATWGMVLPSGPLEMARVASQVAQQARVRVRVGSNTTIVGVGKNPVLRGTWLDIRGTANVVGSRINIIIRNLTFRDTFDCFPQWTPTDGALGNWNSQYDAISLRDSDHVWVDHNLFEDLDTQGRTLPVFFGRIFEVHDGLLDITNGSDLVTISWNHFRNHDKSMLIGSSDGATTDAGKLRLTFHHNHFESLGQRVPRVRYGQVHLYNNFYRSEDVDDYQYSWGVGIQSQIYAENNFFRTDQGVAPSEFISRLNGTAIHASGTLVSQASPLDPVGVVSIRVDEDDPPLWVPPSDLSPVDVIAAYNAVFDPDLLGEVGWTPTLHLPVQPSAEVPVAVQEGAGRFH